MPASMDVGTLKGNNGQGSKLGILAAYKAKSGLTGMTGLLDANSAGWFSMGNRGGFRFLTRDLGRDYWALGMSFKPTPSCRCTHPPITLPGTLLTIVLCAPQMSNGSSSRE